MSEFQVRVVQLGPVHKHPNADTLSITYIGGEGGYPCILRTGDFHEGDKAVYVPIGDVGRDVQALLRIERAEAPEPKEGNLPDPGIVPSYTDLPSLRQYPNLLVLGEAVQITEKIHGETARFALDRTGQFYAGSRIAWKREGGSQGQHWWHVARRLDLEGRLRSYQADTGRHVALFGEVYGDVRGMKYDASSEERGFVLFDAMDVPTRQYLGVDECHQVAKDLRLPHAPVLYRGPWNPELRELAEGFTTMAPSGAGKRHVREGLVVRPLLERWDERVGRVILKLHGQSFHLRGRS